MFVYFVFLPKVSLTFKLRRKASTVESHDTGLGVDSERESRVEGPRGTIKELSPSQKELCDTINTFATTALRESGSKVA